MELTEIQAFLIDEFILSLNVPRNFRKLPEEEITFNDYFGNAKRIKNGKVLIFSHWRDPNSVNVPTPPDDTDVQIWVDYFGIENALILQDAKAKLEEFNA